MAPQKFLLFFSEKHLFSDAIEKIGGCWALHFPKARMKAQNGRYICLTLYIDSKRHNSSISHHEQGFGVRSGAVVGVHAKPSDVFRQSIRRLVELEVHVGTEQFASGPIAEQQSKVYNFSIPLVALIIADCLRVAGSISYRQGPL